MTEKKEWEIHIWYLATEEEREEIDERIFNAVCPDHGPDEECPVESVMSSRPYEDEEIDDIANVSDRGRR